MSRRRVKDGHPAVGSGRIGLAVAEMQTFHLGHHALLSRMRATCDVSIVGLGSVRKFNTPGHPFTFEQRKAMVEAVHGVDAFRFVQLDDIDVRQDMAAWYAYVSKKIEGAGLPDPTDYFTGSGVDALWYVQSFAQTSDPKAPSPDAAIHVNPKTGKRLHIVDRHAVAIPSGRELRLLIESRSRDWKAFVPERIHRFVEAEYPPAMRQPIDLDSWFAELEAASGVSEATRSFAVEATRKDGGLEIDRLAQMLVESGFEVPVGTWIAGECLELLGYERMLELKDDGAWRPLTLAPDDKARWANERGQAR